MCGFNESHTRGIDLGLSTIYRAAVTSKDRLVQARERTRELGKGQTVVVCISLRSGPESQNVSPLHRTLNGSTRCCLHERG
jgi:hypothetical protein